jgi:amino acid adenylation domain-containing protein
VAFNLDLPVRSIFEHPTVSELAALVDETVRTEGAQLEVSKQVDGDIPLSYGQRRLWFMYQLLPDSPAYNVPVGLKMRGALDIGALGAAFSELVRRHEALRTSFRIAGNELVQVVNECDRVDLPVVDVSGLEAGDRQLERDGVARDEALGPFDLIRGPLMRVRLVKLGAEEYEVLLTIHHMVFDGWSLEIVLRELSMLYAGYCTGRKVELPALRLQYREFAQQQMERMKGDALEELLNYWKPQLSGAPSLIELAADRPRPAVQTFKGDVHRFAFDAGERTLPARQPSELFERLRSLSRKQGATIFMALTAAFKALLFRYTQQEDLVIGAPAANRNHSDTELVVGFFTNMLALRTNMGDDPSFSTLISRVRDVAVAAYRHQELPFELLVHSLQPERSLGHAPIFQVVVALHRDPLDQLEFHGLEIRGEWLHTGTAKFDLQLSLIEKEREFVGEIEYRTDIFDASTIERMALHYLNLLREAVTDPSLPISCLSFLTEPERLLLISSPRISFNQGLCLNELFEQHARMSPYQTAAVFEGRRWGYDELNRRSNQLAHYLMGVGIGPETRVAICLERSAEMLIGILAVLKAGAAYVPMEPSYPHQRLEYMLADATPAAVITSSNISTMAARGAPVIDIEGDWESIASQPQADLPRFATPQNAAYVIYTSGSTGSPKGVVVTHENVVRLLRATEHRFHFNSGDVWTLFHSFAFDFSVWEIWGALAYGGRLVIAPYLISRSPDAFYQLLGNEQVTVLNQTPSAFRQLIRAEESTGEKDLALRLVIFGGEALDISSLQGWFERHADTRPELINMYGITETTVHVTYRRVQAADLAASRIGSPIGAAIPDLQLHVMDKRMQPLPMGAVGELYVGGEGVARGYLNRPALTASRFVPDPFSSEPGARLYRSGDLGRRLSQDEVEYCRRADQQVKIRGHRIEIGEIEAALVDHPYVRESVVLLTEQSRDDKRLVAYVVMKNGHDSASAALRDHLKQRLPEYMIPSSFVALESLPLTQNGKVDRRALPDPDMARPEINVSFVEPETEAEITVARVWRELFKIEKVGLEDNFFDLGGNSLLMIEARTRVSEAFNKEISMIDMFRHASVGSLARFLTSSAGRPAPVPKQAEAQVAARRGAMKRREKLRRENRARGAR